MLKYAVVALTALSASAAVVSASPVWQYDYNRGGGPALGPTGAGVIDSITSIYDENTKVFSWDVVIGDGVTKNTNGYWLVVSPGPNPLPSVSQYAIIYFDATSIANPAVSIYRYDGTWGQDSFSRPTADLLASTRIPGQNDIRLQITDTGPARRFQLAVDTATINAAFSNPEWKGIQFGSQIGTWFHNVVGLQTAYSGTALTQFTFREWGFWDISGVPTRQIPAPGSVAMLAMGGLLAARRRR